VIGVGDEAPVADSIGLRGYGSRKGIDYR